MLLVVSFLVVTLLAFSRLVKAQYPVIDDRLNHPITETLEAMPRHDNQPDGRQEHSTMLLGGFGAILVCCQLLISPLAVQGAAATPVPPSVPCAVEPRSWSFYEERAVDAAAAPATAPAEATPTIGPGMAPAILIDDATLKAISESAELLVACINAGDRAALLALLSTHAVERLFSEEQITMDLIADWRAGLRPASGLGFALSLSEIVLPYATREGTIAATLDLVVDGTVSVFRLNVVFAFEDGMYRVESAEWEESEGPSLTPWDLLAG
jgi:hypothetical protein